MARYRFSVDAGQFIGARYLTLDFDGKKISGLFVPDKINGIEVKSDNREEGKRNVSGFRAFLNFRQFTGKSFNKYIQSVKEGLMRKGEPITLHNVPAYQVAYSLPEAKRNAIRAALAKYVIAQNPELATQTDTEGTDLARAISTLMPFQMGDSYLMEDQQQAAAPVNNSAPVTQGVSGYSSAVAAPADSEWQSPQDDDLPF